MAFPTLSELDAIVIPAMATADELTAVHRTRDGTETACVAWLDDVNIDSYTDSGVIATSPRQQVTIQRADVARPQEHETVQFGADVYRLLSMVDFDASKTVWAVAGIRGEGT